MGSEPPRAGGLRGPAPLSPPRGPKSGAGWLVLPWACPGPCRRSCSLRAQPPPPFPQLSLPHSIFFSFPPSVRSSGGCQVPGRFHLPSLPVPDFAPPFPTEIPCGAEGLRPAGAANPGSPPGVSCAGATVPGVVWGPQGGQPVSGGWVGVGGACPVPAGPCRGHDVPLWQARWRFCE